MDFVPVERPGLGRARLDRKESLHGGDAFRPPSLVFGGDEIGEVAREALAGAFGFGARTRQQGVVEGHGDIRH
jgi:hypothetical protein